MSAAPPPLEIILKFTNSRRVTASSSFSWQEEEYWVEHSDGSGASVRFPWNEPWLRPALESWDAMEFGSEVTERLRQCLQDFLTPTRWALEEDRIERALNEKPPRPVHLIIRSNADELYYLPWELLRLKSGKRLAGLEDCLIQYECPGSHQERQSPPQGRILFAYATIGGGTPAPAHLAAIREACKKANFPFDPAQDVLHEVSRKTLVEKLSETARPVTVLHLLCHGTRVGNIAYGLTFHSVDAPHEADPIDAADLQDLLFSAARPQSLRLVTLCSCQGGDAGPPSFLLGSVARMFHQQGVPAVIASRMPLTCEGSVILTEMLYEGLLVRRENLRTVLSAARGKLRQMRSRDSLSLQFYARAGDASALTPFSEPLPFPPTPSARQLILIRHEAYSKVPVKPEPADAPALFAGRQPREVPIDQTAKLEQRDWDHLNKEVKELAAVDGPLRLAYAERDADVAYYGFPFVPLAALAGFLAKNRQVHVFEYVSGRFQWESGSGDPQVPLKVDMRTYESGSTVRLRVSVSAPVHLDDCRQVLPDSEVKLDLHFELEDPKRGIVRREAQLKAYVQAIQDTLDKYIAGNPGLRLESVHVFAAVPVSVAFLLGRAMAATWLPECFVYNYGKTERPAYKWRLSLQAAAQGKDSVRVFKKARKS